MNSPVNALNASNNDKEDAFLHSPRSDSGNQLIDDKEPPVNANLVVPEAIPNFGQP